MRQRPHTGHQLWSARRTTWKRTERRRRWLRIGMPKIEARIERDRALPGDIDLAGARAQRAFWAARAATMHEHLEQYR